MRTMPLPDITARLMEINHCDNAMAERFLSEFSALVQRALTESGTIHINGIGTFRRIEFGGEVTVEYAPDASLAEAVNAPFAMFEPVELDDGVTGDMLDEAGKEHPAHNRETASTRDNHAENQVDAPCLPEGIPPIPPQAKATPADAPMEEVPGPVPADDTATAECEPHATVDIPAASAQETTPVTHEKIIEKERVVEIDRSHHTMNLILTAFTALLAGLLIGYFAYDKLNLSQVKSVNISADDVQVYHQQKADPAAVAPAEPETGTETATSNAAEPADDVPDTGKDTDIDAKTRVVTDTVKSNRFLTTMAQEHYGKKKFWVYIYLENSDKLDDPDRIAANTMVVIPHASKYGIRSGDPASEADAERKATEIMNRYSKNN